MLAKLPITWFLIFGPLLATTACRDEQPAPFLLEVDVRPATNAPAGISFSVNGEDTSRIWQGSYTSLAASCAYLEENPLQVACLDLDGSSCGVSEVFGVCCWAPNVVASPIVKGTLYVSFAGMAQQMLPKETATPLTDLRPMEMAMVQTAALPSMRSRSDR